MTCKITSIYNIGAFPVMNRFQSFEGCKSLVLNTCLPSKNAVMSKMRKQKAGLSGKYFLPKNLKIRAIFFLVIFTNF